MKCINHPEADAVGICISCSIPVCSACCNLVENKTYCQPCSNIPFVPFKQKRSVKLSLGGILGIVTGLIDFLGGMVLIFLGLHSYIGGGCEDVSTINWSVMGWGLTMLILGCIAMIGSRSAMDEEYFGVALAGGICAALSLPPLGVPALILIVKSKKEFR